MRYIIFLFSVILTISCTSKYEFAEYKGVQESGWKSTDTLTYNIKIDDITKVYDISIAVRHNKNYEFNNIWFKVFGNIVEKSKSGAMEEIILFDKTGKPYGKCTGSLCTQIYPIQQKYKFHKKGTHIIKVVHLMRQEPLLGIKDVGIIVDYSK